MASPLVQCYCLPGNPDKLEQHVIGQSFFFFIFVFFCLFFFLLLLFFFFFFLFCFVLFDFATPFISIKCAFISRIIMSQRLKSAFLEIKVE